MKICFFSEGNYRGKVSNQSIGRTDLNWIYTNDATHIPISDLTSDEKFDIGIYIVPKKSPKLDLDTLFALRRICTKIGIMQEAAHDTFQEHPIDVQVNFINFITAVDFVMCHNEIDYKYYKGIVDNVFIQPTLMLTDNLQKDKITLPHKRDGVMLGGTLSKWYNGLDSLIIASSFDEEVYIPSMGRKTALEDNLSLANYVPYHTNWNNWMYELSKRKYAVHLMRTAAAGSFPLNCAFLKIPCIGWNTCDTQRLLFPKLSFEVGDMQSALKTAKHLATNEQFFNHVIEYAFMVMNDIYSKENYLKTMKEHYEKILQV